MMGDGGDEEIGRRGDGETGRRGEFVRRAFSA